MKTRGFYSLNAFNLHGVDLKSMVAKEAQAIFS